MSKKEPSPKRKIKGIWIPVEIWEHQEISLQEKVFLAEIDSLSGDKGCWANNRYFSEFFQLSTRRVSDIINSLVKKGFSGLFSKNVLV